MNASSDQCVCVCVVVDRTSSSAVAKRPRDASYLSVVSFNSTKRRVESFIVSYVGYRSITASRVWTVCDGYWLM